MRLSEHNVKNLKPKDKRYTQSDNGLTVEVNPSGKKIFFYKFRQDGVQHKPKLGEYPAISVAEAKKLVLDKKHEIQIQGIKQPILEVSFKEFVEGEYKEWLFASNKSAQASYKTIQAHFLPLLADTRIKNINARMIEAWKVKRLTKGISAATIARNLTELRMIFSRVQDWHNLPSFMPSVKNPKITTEKEQILLTPDEVTKLKNTCDKYIANHHFPEDKESSEWNTNNLPIMLPFIVQTAINTGMRRGEILQLKHGDISKHGDRSIITIRGSTEKTSRTRDVPISDKMAESLGSWMGICYGGDYKIDKNDLVFPTTTIKTAWKTFRKRAGLEHIEFKTLRHHFASSLVLKGVALTTVMKLMGHTNIKTTQRYLSVLMEDKFDAVNLL